ncbi:MAG: amino acid ABC transporter permease [Pseudobdellovibrionaceae bacterium]|nr:amino acid ABC transporter permease [Pseudobdellovibrionaceae bacterium]
MATSLTAWSRFAKKSPLQLLITGLLVLGLIYLAWPVFDWLFFKAQFTGNDRSACTGEGACWLFVRERFDQFIFGFYEKTERWRPIVVTGLWLLGFVPLRWTRFPGRKLTLPILLVLLPVSSWFILRGGFWGLPLVETSRWGGLMLTLLISAIGISLSLPLGILLALGRRSSLPLLRLLTVTFIELWRGVPLITVLFMASVMLPFLLPPGVEFDKLLRCLVGVVLFTSAYMAEVVRAGLQAVPKGQHEAASALGFGYWQSTALVVLPQALRLVIPGIVNTFISLFKDTSLVLIIGMFDLLGMVQAASTDPEWMGFAMEGYVFAGLVFWLFCFSMSRTSMRLEKRLEQAR